VQRDLGDGLGLRRARPSDVDELAAFNARIHAEPDAPGPDEEYAGWTRDLFHGHPACRPEDFTVVEDTATGRIVSSLNLIAQTWSYDGIPFGVGRIELVGTDEAYRRRGLVRAQFDVVHGWSRERGDLTQAIFGIPWYYRQFGYEYALPLEGGERAPRHLLPGPAAGGAAPYRVRPATETDAPFIAELDAHARARYLVTVVRDELLWRYEIAGRGEPLWQVQVVESAAGEPAGYVAHDCRLRGTTLRVAACELRPGLSWLAVKDGLLRYLRATGEAHEEQGEGQRFEQLAFLLEHDHPLYEAIPDTLTESQRPNEWYVRVPDVPAFLRLVAPVLERRLAGSVAGGYSGDVRLNFYRDGALLSFEDGQLERTEPWAHPDRHAASASFPELTFLQALFGHRSLDELAAIFPDCSARTEEGRVLVNALFPKRPSLVWGAI
jgi:hypothetical protein